MCSFPELPGLVRGIKVPSGLLLAVSWRLLTPFPRIASRTVPTELLVHKIL